MPQMMPMKWLILMFIYLLIFMKIMIMFYSLYLPYLTPTSQINKINWNWKW